MKIVLNDAFNKSQLQENVVGIWWYNPSLKLLEYSNEAKGHLDSDCFTLHKKIKNDRNIVRGRFLLIAGKTYLIIFRNPETKITKDSIKDIRNKIENVSEIKVDHIIDDSGALVEAEFDLKSL